MSIKFQNHSVGVFPQIFKATYKSRGQHWCILMIHYEKKNTIVIKCKLVL